MENSISSDLVSDGLDSRPPLPKHMTAQVSIMEPLRRKRAKSTPRPHTDPIPNPWHALGPLGDKVTRTATALAELAVETANNPELWPMQEQIAEAVTHEFLAATDKSWRCGIAHGKLEQQLQSRRDCFDEVLSLQAQFSDLQMRFDALELRHEETKAALDRSSLRCISNVLVD